LGKEQKNIYQKLLQPYGGE